MSLLATGIRLRVTIYPYIVSQRICSGNQLVNPLPLKKKNRSPCSSPLSFLFVSLGFRGLHEIDGDTKQAIVDLLSKKRLPGLASWKQVARRYAMRETKISSLEIEKIPACALLEGLTSLTPNLTVYYLCKTFKEAGLRRLDVVDVLSKHMLIPVY